MNETASILEMTREMALDAGRIQRESYEQDFLIDPQCSYVDAQFKRHSDWRDLRA